MCRNIFFQPRKMLFSAFDCMILLDNKIPLLCSLEKRFHRQPCLPVFIVERDRHMKLGIGDTDVISAALRILDAFGCRDYFVTNFIRIVGAIAGGWLFNTFGAAGVTGLNLYSLLVAVIGSVVLLVAYHAIRRTV